MKKNMNENIFVSPIILNSYDLASQNIFANEGFICLRQSLFYKSYFKNLFIFLIIIINNINVFGQNNSCLAKSDSLYAIGVELYNKGNYTDAIPYFEECNNIDKEACDSNSSQAKYSSMWLASSYYMSGDSTTARNINEVYFKFTPIDRRNTTQLDSLSSILPSIEDLTTRIALAQEIYERETKIVGGTHPYCINTLVTLAILYTMNEDIVNAYSCYEKIWDSTRDNPDDYIFDEMSLKWIFNNILYKSNQLPNFRISFEIDRMIALVNSSKFLQGRFLWGDLFETKCTLLQNQNKAVECDALIDKAFQEFRHNGVVNGNSYIVYSLFGTTLAQKTKLAKNQNEKEELCKKRENIYNELLSISKLVYGDKSYEQGKVVYKIANLYLGYGLEIDKERGKDLLVEAFDIIAQDSTNQFRVDELTDLFETAYIPFDVAGCPDLFIKYVKDAIEVLSQNPYVDISKLQEIYARSLIFSTHDNTINGIQLLSNLIDNNINNTNKVATLLNMRAHGYKRIKDLNNSLADYTQLDSLYKNIIRCDESLFLTMSVRNSIKKNISEIYLELSDSINSESYWDQYCNIEENIIDNIAKGVYGFDSQTDLYKFEIIKDYALNFLTLPSQLHYDIDKAIFFSKLNLDILPKLFINDEIKQDCELSMLNILSSCYFIKKDFANGYKTSTTLIESSKLQNNYHHYINGIHKLSQLYEFVSIEPELSLEYRFSGAEFLSNYLFQNRNKMLDSEYITTRDLLSHEWDKCIETFKYLGDESATEECYDKMFMSIINIDGMNSPAYVDAKMRWYLYYKIPQYFPWNKNEKEQGKLWADKMVDFYEKNCNLITYPRIFNYLIIGDQYRYLDDYSKASKYYDLYESNLRTNSKDGQIPHLDYLQLMTNRFKLLPDKERLDSLETLMPIYELISDQNPKEYRYYLYSLSSLSHDLKITGKELIYNNRILNETNDSIILQPLIRCYLNKKDYNSIVPLFEQASKYARLDILEEFKESTSFERELLLDNYYDIPFNLGEGLADMFGEAISSKTLYDNVLMRKNTLLCASISAENLIKSEGDSLLLAKYERKKQLDNFLDSDSEEFKFNSRIISREQARKLSERFDSEIMKRAAILGNLSESISINWEDVERNINSNDLAIEFSRYLSLNGKYYYSALVLEKGKEPVYCKLCSEDELMLVPNNRYYKSNELYNLLWEPLENYFKGKSNIYFAPDGNLYNIALEYILNNQKINLSSKYNLYRVSSTRELAIKKSALGINQVALYGGMNYEAGTEFLVQDMDKYPELRDVDRSFIFDTDSLNLRSGASNLPGTGVEIDNIKQAFNRATIDPLFFKGLDGSEASFKALSGKKINIMHIATHGFYWTESEARRTSGLQFLQNNVSSSNEDKALNRSGILFSGANNALRGKKIPNFTEDGILTAKEISILDLRGLNMVVLSACQTGLGEIKGDGVFGLQRGFKKAGANSLLMSLWKVDDRATQMLMTKFYEHFISGKSKLESLSLAQQYLREFEEEIEEVNDANLTAFQRRKSQRFGDDTAIETIDKTKVRPYADPKFWAAFILLDALD